MFPVTTRLQRRLLQSNADEKDPITPIMDPPPYNEYPEGVSNDTPPLHIGYEAVTEGSDQVERGHPDSLNK